MKRNIRIILLVAIFVLSLSNFIACASKNAEASPVKYKKDSLRDITFTYPGNYEPDYRDENQTSYLLNSNEGIISIVCWDDNIKEDISYKGEHKEFNGIDGYYWKDEDGYEIAFIVKDSETGKPVEYYASADHEDVFWNIVDSIKEKN